MSTQSLGSVASQVIGHYEEAGKILIGAYRAGATRLVTRASERYVSYLDGKSLPLIGDQVKASLISANQQFVDIVGQAIERDTARVEKVIDLVVGGVQTSIKRLSATAERAEAVFENSALSTAANSFAMPAAQISLEIASKTVEGTKRLADRVAAADSVVAEVVTEAAPAKRAPRKTSRRSRA